MNKQPLPLSASVLPLLALLLAPGAAPLDAARSPSQSSIPPSAPAAYLPSGVPATWWAQIQADLDPAASARSAPYLPFPRPNWLAEGNQTNAYFGASVSTAGDVNGDGFDDVIVGAPLYSNGQTHEGKVFVYYGSAAGLSLTPNWTAESDQAGASFGVSVGTAGDVNGDGYDDVMVGAPTYTDGEANEGGAFLYFGSASGLSTTPNWTAESNQARAHFGECVGTAGDVNGDGYDDVVVGSVWYDDGEVDEGAVFVYYGSPAGPSPTADWTAEGNQTGAWLGVSAGTAGDVNRDGYDDLIVGSYYYDDGEVDEGAAFVYHGSPSGLSTSPNWTAEGNQTRAFFGRSVRAAGDVNGDGYSDVIVGAWGYDNGQTDEGRAFVYHGSATGLSLTPNWTAEGDQDYAGFGRAVSGAGDTNGDGFDDVIIGAFNYQTDLTSRGTVYIYRGSATGLAAKPYWVGATSQDHALFGRSVSRAGNVNADGYGDVIIGASGFSHGQLGEGIALSYYGSGQ